MRRRVYRLTLLAALWLTAGITLVAAPSSLEFAPSSEFDFGTFPANLAQKKVFTLRNRGAAAIRILGINSNCGCAAGQPGKMLLQPGETTRFDVTIIANSVAGTFEKKIFLRTDEPSRALSFLTLRGNAVPLVTIAPDAKLYQSDLPLRQPWEKVFRLLHNASGIRWGEPRVESKIAADAKLSETSPKETHLTVKITAPEQYAHFVCRVVVPILEPRGWPPVVVEIAGSFGRRLLAEPSRILIPAAGVKPFVRKIKLSLSGGKPIEAKLLTFSGAPGLNGRVVAQKGGVLELEVAFNPEALKSRRDGRPIEFTLAYPDCRPVAISFVPVRFLDL